MSFRLDSSTIVFPFVKLLCSNATILYLEKGYICYDGHYGTYALKYTNDGSFRSVYGRSHFLVLFNSLSLMPDLLQSTTRKVLLLTVHLTTCEYTSVHLKRSENVWVDLITRWTALAFIDRLKRSLVSYSTIAPDF